MFAVVTTVTKTAVGIRLAFRVFFFFTLAVTVVPVNFRYTQVDGIDNYLSFGFGPRAGGGTSL